MEDRLVSAYLYFVFPPGDLCAGLGLIFWGGDCRGSLIAGCLVIPRVQLLDKNVYCSVCCGLLGVFSLRDKTTVIRLRLMFRFSRSLS